MQLKTIFNHVVDYKPFVVDKVEFIGEMPNRIEITMRSRSNGRAICSGCGKRRPGYDRQSELRRFDFLPLWLIPVVLLYTMRRVSCPECGIKVERVPWSDGKSPLTTELKCSLLAGWARRMSWDHVYNSVKHAVSWGLTRRDLSAIESIGVDESQWHCGHKYQTLVYQIDEGRKRLQDIP